ncbi:MAG: heme/hemin ABC transporter substrate-binding protein, partial [Halomonas sp.]|uniref:heme/hemin ABC transporter substrate-binding protein n=1 Tax=Halomonas sp. TaxID=1486246 RepID=UPI003F8E7516
MLRKFLTTPTLKARRKPCALFIGLLLILAIGLSSLAMGNTDTGTQSGTRVLVLGGDVAEIVAELGAADQLIARDDTVTYPPTLTELPSVGYLRNLSSESVLKIKPDRIIASAEAGPREVLAQIEATGVSLARIQLPDSQPSVRALFLSTQLDSKIRQVAHAIGRDAQGAALSARLASRYQQVNALPELNGLKVMFLLHHGGMTPMVGGRSTSADRVIKLLGASNAFADFEGYKPVSAEGLIPAAPEVVVLPQRGLEALGGEDGLW